MTRILLAVGVFAAIVLIVPRVHRDEDISMPGIEAADERPEIVESRMLAGRKTQATPLLRRETGVGMKEAKEEVEARMGGNSAASPCTGCPDCREPRRGLRADRQHLRLRLYAPSSTLGLDAIPRVVKPLVEPP